MRRGDDKRRDLRRHPTAPGAATVPSPGPPKETEQVRKVQLPPQNPFAFTYDANGQPSEARRPTRATRERSERPEEASTSGNITTLVNTTAGAVSATYDYSPFGLTVSKTGPAGRMSDGFAARSASPE